MSLSVKNTSPIIVKCPRCGKSVHWAESEKHRPFCSERCKLIDLGEWASESNVIPGEPIVTELLDFQDPDNDY